MRWQIKDHKLHHAGTKTITAPGGPNAALTIETDKDGYFHLPEYPAGVPIGFVARYISD